MHCNLKIMIYFFFLDENYKCIKYVTNQYESLKKKCPCKVACKYVWKNSEKIYNPNSIFVSHSETDFSAVISSSTWPSKQYWVGINHFNF